MEKNLCKLISSAIVLMTIFAVFTSITNNTSPIILEKAQDDVPSIASDGISLFYDDFGDSSINSIWTVVPHSGLVTESVSGYLALNSTYCDWWGINNLLVDVGCNAPYAYVDMPATDFVLTTRNLNAGNMEAGQAGLILYLDEDNVVLFGGAKGGYGIGVSVEGISANRVWNAGIASSGTVTNQYLRVRKESGTYYFDYSANGASWTTLTTRTEAFFEFTPAKVGLFEKNWNGAYEAQFDFFNLTGQSQYWSYSILVDEFNDQSINPVWTQVLHDGNITELAEGYLQLNSTYCDWWGINDLLVDVGCNAPYAYVDMPATDFVLTTRNLNAGNMEAGQAGLILYLDEDNVVLFGGAKGGYGIGVSVEGISANRVWNAGIASSGTVTNQYLRVRKESGTYYFDYSADGASWITLTSRTEAFFEFTPAKVGLFEKNWNGAYEAQFDFFNLTGQSHLPLISSSESFSYDFMSLKNNITWLVIDPDTNNANYTVYKNGSTWGTPNQPWTSGVPFNVSVDGLTIGDYNFTIVATDGYGANMSDTVIVTVFNSVPNISGPGFVMYEVGTSKNNITWAITDPSLLDPRFTVYKNGSTWGTPNQPWTSGVPFNVSVDGLTTGDHNFTIIASDGYGEINASNEVLVRVVIEIPQIEGPLPFSYELGSINNVITWNITDLSTQDPTYTVYNNGSDWGALNQLWSNGVPVTVNIDGLSAGDHNFTIIVQDGKGASTSHQIIVNVYIINTNGTWQPIALNAQLIKCKTSPTTFMELFLMGQISGMNIRITTHLSNPVNVPLEGGVAFFGIDLEYANSIEYPVSAHFYYNESLLEGDTPETSLGVYHLENGDWVLLESEVVATENYIIVSCQGFSYYAIAPVTSGPSFDWGFFGMILSIIAAIMVTILLIFKFRVAKGNKPEEFTELEFD